MKMTQAQKNLKKALVDNAIVAITVYADHLMGNIDTLTDEEYELGINDLRSACWELSSRLARPKDEVCE